MSQRGKKRGKGCLLSFSFLNTLGLSSPDSRGRFTKGSWAVCATARGGARSGAWPASPLSPGRPPVGMVRKYKSGSNAGHHVQTEEGTELLQSLLATDLPMGSECTKVLWRRVSSQSREGGWLLSLSLGKVLGERGAETVGEGWRGAFPSFSSR